MHSSKWSAITFLLIVLLGTLFLSGIPFLVSNHNAKVYEGNTGRNATPGALRAAGARPAAGAHPTLNPAAHPAAGALRAASAGVHNDNPSNR